MVRIATGDVITTHKREATRANQWNRSWPIPVGRKLVVTRVFADTLLARGPLRADGGDVSVRLYRSDVETINGARIPGTDRPIGETPVGDIGKDDPRIQWIFKDMAHIADTRGWCDEYDDMCDELGIPGRFEDIEFNEEVEIEDGSTVEVSFTVRGRDRDEAIHAVGQALTGWMS